MFSIMDNIGSSKKTTKKYEQTQKFFKEKAIDSKVDLMLEEEEKEKDLSILAEGATRSSKYRRRKLNTYRQRLQESLTLKSFKKVFVEEVFKKSIPLSEEILNDYDRKITLLGESAFDSMLEKGEFTIGKFLNEDHSDFIKEIFIMCSEAASREVDDLTKDMKGDEKILNEKDVTEKEVEKKAEKIVVDGDFNDEVNVDLDTVTEQIRKKVTDVIIAEKVAADDREKEIQAIKDEVGDGDEVVSESIKFQMLMKKHKRKPTLFKALQENVTKETIIEMKKDGIEGELPMSSILAESVLKYSFLEAASTVKLFNPDEKTIHDYIMKLKY